MPEWYLRRGTIKAAIEDRLEAASSSCELWGIGCAGLVVAGVIAEFVISGIHPLYDSFLEQWGSATANAVVAIGIVGEVAFGMWDSRIQTELRKRSNEKLGAAEKAAGDANARAAEANMRALEAELALAKFRQPRRLLIRGNEAKVTERLKAFPKTRFDAGLNGSGEVADFWWDLAPALVAADWMHLSWLQVGNGIGFNQHPLPSSGIVGATDVEIHILPAEREALEPAATALIDILNELGIAAKDAGFNTHSANPMTIHIHIGEKG